ncbi:P-loop containing nucleoside triphosphate hydrolase protein [Chytridium lagenaria]|nr:P-loop containing nucleoside triphosphate hydrolase protein [Chytridium lagenaria]
MGVPVNRFRHPDIIVSTPTHCLSGFKNKKTLSSFLQRTECIVFDEADATLSNDGLGLLKKLQRDLGTEPKRQFVFAGATFPTTKTHGKSDPMIHTLNRLFPDLKVISTETHHRFSARLRQTFIRVSSEKLNAQTEFELKLRALTKLVKSLDTARVLVFCRSDRRLEMLRECLEDEFGETVMVSSVHGDMEQDERRLALIPFLTENTMQRVSVLIATDIMARGIDFKDLDVVVSFDFPNTVEIYLHRVGRCARFEKSGEAISFVTLKDETIAKVIEATLFEDGVSMPILPSFPLIKKSSK